MNSSRTKNSIINIIYTLGSYFIVLLLQMINRSIFVKYLPTEYLGINGLFSNILSILSLSELGIGTAITYALYKPLKENAIDIVKSIMYLYKRLYTVIGIIVFILGVILLPFLGWFIEEVPDYLTIRELQIYYLIYLLNTSVSYFGTYKRTLLICNQQQYITSIVSSGCKSLLTIMQIVILSIFKDYGLYITLLIITTVLENIILTVISNRKFPYLKDKKINKLDSEISKDIKKNIFAMIFHRIGDVVINASDNLIITKFASLALTGLYSNYIIIVSAIKTILNQVFSAITASVGNLLAYNDKNKDKEVFDNILFLNFVIYSYCTLCLAIILNDFVEIWLGKKFLLDVPTVVVICYSFYFTGMQKTVRIFRDAAGVFYFDRYKPIVEAIVNIIFSIPLTIKYQIFGTIIGTIISCLFVSFGVEGYILFKHHFSISPKKYFLRQFFYVLIFSFELIICNYIMKLFTLSGVINLFVKLLLITIVYILTIVVIFRTTKEFYYFTSLLKRILQRKI